MEDLDRMAGAIAYKHVLGESKEIVASLVESDGGNRRLYISINIKCKLHLLMKNSFEYLWTWQWSPLEILPKTESGQHLTMVTASCDRIDLFKLISSHHDLLLRGSKHCNIKPWKTNRIVRKRKKNEFDIDSDIEYLWWVKFYYWFSKSVEKATLKMTTIVWIVGNVVAVGRSSMEILITVDSLKPEPERVVGQFQRRKIKSIIFFHHHHYHYHSQWKWLNVFFSFLEWSGKNDNGCKRKR